VNLQDVKPKYLSRNRGGGGVGGSINSISSISSSSSSSSSSKGKGKANPLQALKSPEGSRRLRLPDFKAIGT
jgi:hypothetical protein